MRAVLLVQEVVRINDLLTQITAVFVTIGGASMGTARPLKQQGIIEDDRFWPIPDMAQGMRVEHDRLVQLGWVYDGFGGYRKKAASSHPGPKLAASNALNVSASALRWRGHRVCNSTGRRTPKSRRGDDWNGAQLSFSFFNR